MTTSKLFFTLLILFAFLPASAQSELESWSLPIEENTKWISVDKQTHTVFYYTGEAVKSYDYVKKDYDWEVDVHDFKGAKYTYDEKDPYLILSQEKAFSFNDKMKKVAIIDRMNGELLFNSHNSAVFDESQVHFSLDHRYALLLRIEKIKKDKKKGIEKKINKYLSLIKIGQQKSLWTVLLSNEEAYGGLPNFLNTTNDFKFGPVGNEEVVVFSYGKYLYAFNVADGSVRWKKPLEEEKIRFLRVTPSTHRDQGFMVGYEADENRDYSLNYIDFDKGEPIWEEPFDLGKYFSITYGPEWILVKSSYGFNYLNYDGELKWNDYIKTEGIIEKVYQQQNGYLITEKQGDDHFFNWYDTEQRPVFKTPLPLNSPVLKEGVNLDGYIILVTDTYINTYDVASGLQIANVYIPSQAEYSINRADKSVVFTDNGQTGYIIKHKDNNYKLLTEKRFFTEKKDSICRIESWHDTNVFVSDNEMVQFSNDGTLLNRVYYKQPTNWLAAGLVITAAVLGTVYADQIYASNMSARNQGLIDAETYQNNLDLMGRDKYGQVTRLGVGGASAQATADVIGLVSKDRPYNPFEQINRLWFYRDKLEDGKWGLRVIDLYKGEEIRQIPFGKNKDFDYKVDEIGEVLMNVSNEEIKFYKL